MYCSDESISRSSNSGHRGDLASVMSFTSTNTASSRGSVAKGQVQGQQMGPVPLQIAPQQLGTKVKVLKGDV
ncbi:hypothetical protein DPMN_181177 [Dreissena polymorpha]|uniref:Uncharacterized protein n=1 Tax=Dreissena polymorpha TaxID=45954 RepID=A0A9D4DD67_DREPO|nr:hypothetical protein DPMN_181177 [Dreissena polymorpha]